MKRIREKNINTANTFNLAFQDNFSVFNNYKNILFYNKFLQLNLFNSGSYLDYGCGGGEALSKIKANHPNSQVFGVDISDYVIKKNSELFKGISFLTIEDYYKNNLNIDNILSSHTFEHIEDPIFIAKQLLERINKKFIIIVPYKDSWQECEQHLWCFNEHSFDILKPTWVMKGIINRAANRELIFCWDKDNSNKKLIYPVFIYEWLMFYKHHPIGLLKIFLKKIKVLK